HHPRFQALESAWRGLDFAIRQMDDSAARIHIVQYSKADLAGDLASDNLRATRLYPLLHARHWTAAIGLHSFDESEIELLACLAILARAEADNLNLDSLPAHTYKHDSEWLMTPCAEVFMTETQVLTLIEHGLMPLISYKDRPMVRLAGFRSVTSARIPFVTP